MLTMLGTFAEFERELMRERQREGVAIAKAKGIYRARRKRWDPSGDGPYAIAVSRPMQSGAPSASAPAAHGPTIPNRCRTCAESRV
jgi:hypothetical protein